MYLVCAERSLYWVCWISTITYALYEFARICQSRDHLYRLNPQDFKDGMLSSNLYDASDFEWQSFKKLYTDFWYIVLIHFGCSNIFTAYDQPYLKFASWIFITLYATFRVFSFAALLVVIINVIMLILLAILGKNILSYALCAGVVLASQSTEIANRIFDPSDPRMTNEFDFEEKRFLFMYCLCFLNARGLSSSIDNLAEKQKKTIQSGKDQFYEKVITIASYLLYLPGFFAGPIYLYNDFERATRLVKAEPKKEAFLGSSYSKSMIAVFVLIANLICYEWLLHWLYSSAVINDTSLVSGYGPWQLSGLVASLCILFYMKYTCIYRTFKVLATLDGIGSVAPPLPQCVAAMHLNSQLWRNFDAGIYIWLKRYIYDPIIARSSSTITKFVATLTCFACVALWHLPLTPNLLLWLSLNFMCALIEIWANSLSKMQVWSRLVGKLTRPNHLRLLAIIGLPMFFLAIYSNLLFLSSNEQVSYEFLRRTLNNTDNYSLFLIIVLFCGVNVSLDYNAVVKRPEDFAQKHGLSCLARLNPCGTQVAKKTKKAN